ncbi:hypothetical protein PRUPE_7G027000 [Prunus persica]|uniref:USP domain-containing protein n=1 Tax=Prunus persica TaxID=3760 RepID=A0A251N5Y8_PRUPE|nr:ubiquitin carboxyl-terminal hydrolase 5 isoform X2 [Prunus persica]ONH94737.1 hypothetical protein PRUPE_7G027000 [Prunus persica]
MTDHGPRSKIFLAISSSWTEMANRFSRIQGELALAFGELLGKLWAPGRTPVAPRPFKTKLARFAPQFSGHNQHDSQELLAFLLDGLHEDLNRVKHKPYVNFRDADVRPDEDVADEYLANHIARNDSIIVDVCQVADNFYRPNLKKAALARVNVGHRSLKVSKFGVKKRNRQVVKTPDHRIIEKMWHL